MRRRRIVTLLVGALVVAGLLRAVDLFAVDTFATLYLPVILLAILRVRPVLHWILLVGTLVFMGVALIAALESDSSTAGLGLMFLFFLLIVGLVVAANVDHFLSERRERRM